MSLTRLLFIPLLFCPGPIWATERLDQEFWEYYEPFDQYSEETIRDLRGLEERDLLRFHRRLDGIVFRVVGRNSAFSKLVSARISVDAKTRSTVTVKVLPSGRSRSIASLSVRSRVVSAESAAALLALLERHDFWSAPADEVRSARADGLEVICFDAGGWLIEGVTPDRYQQIFRSNCERLDPAAAEIRDFLLALVGVTPGGFE